MLSSSVQHFCHSLIKCNAQGPSAGNDGVQVMTSGGTVELRLSSASHFSRLMHVFTEGPLYAQLFLTFEPIPPSLCRDIKWPEAEGMKCQPTLGQHRGSVFSINLTIIHHKDIIYMFVYVTYPHNYSVSSVTRPLWWEASEDFLRVAKLLGVLRRDCSHGSSISRT